MLVMQLVPEWFVAGGPVMWAILLGSFMTVGVLFEKLWSLRRRAVLQPGLGREVQALVRAGRIDEAARHCADNPGPHSEIALAALEAFPYGREEVVLAVRAAARQVGARLARFLTVVRTVASVSPLLGLFGTVLGMIEVFSAISTAGLGQMGGLSSGIEKALITTAFGLGVAIPSLVVHETFQARVDRLLLKKEREIINLMTTLLRTSAARPPAEAAPTAAAGGSKIGGG